MDLREAIRQLTEQKEKVEHAIAELERLQGHDDSATPLRNRRGRKSMSEVERRDVSERMKKYWASRRKPRPN